MTDTTTPVWRHRASAAGLVAGGLLLGGVITGTVTATAASIPTPDASVSVEQAGAAPDLSQPQRSDEQLLTGDTLEQVTSAVLAEYPGATMQRVETDSDGVYEAHIVTADGESLQVALDADFAITGTTAGGSRGGRGGGDCPDGAVPSAEQSVTPSSTA